MVSEGQDLYGNGFGVWAQDLVNHNFIVMDKKSELKVG
jgi:hypothetical protein